MNSKIALDELKKMTYDDYSKSIKKEIKRATLDGTTDFITFTDFVFVDTPEPKTVFIFGKFTGRLQKFYKEQRKARAKEKDFARGIAVFKENSDGTTKIHLNMESGKAKASKFKKHGKRLFTKLKLDIELTECEVDLDEVEVDEIVSEREQEEMLGNAEEIVENKSMRRIHRDYFRTFQTISETVIPKIKAKQVLTKEDFVEVKNLHVLSLAYIEEYNQLPEKSQSKYKEHLEKVEASADFVKKLYAKVKQMGMEQNEEEQDISIVTNQSQYDIVQKNINALFEEAKAIQHDFSNIEAALQVHEKSPLIASKVPELVKPIQEKLNGLQAKTNTIPHISLAQQKEIENQLAAMHTQLTEALKTAESFEVERIKKLEEIRVVEVEFGNSWNAILVLAETCARIIMDKKAATDKSQKNELFKYEHKILSELKESLEYLIKNIQSKSENIIQLLAKKLDNAQQQLKKVTAFINNCTISAHPTQKDEYFNAYAEINQSDNIGDWVNTVEKLNKWMLEQEQLAKAFETPVEIKVNHINQKNFYTEKDLTEQDKKGKTIEQAIKDKNATACYRTAEAIIKNTMAKQGKKYAVGSTYDKTFESIYVEDKSQVREITKDGKQHYESLESDALVAAGDPNKAYQYILDNLNLNNPILVGVDHTYNRDIKSKNTSKASSGYNSDKTSDHFIVIYGKGMENKVPYLLYMDPGSARGDSKDNKLYPLWKGDNLYWYDPSSPLNKSYVITSIAKSKYE